MRPLEIIAVIFITVSLIKIISLSVNPQFWNRNIVKKIFNNSHVSSLISFILSLVVLYYLVQEISIVQILAVMAFAGLLILYGFSISGKEVIDLLNKIYKDRSLIKKSLIYIIFWLILLIWGLKEIISN